MQKTLYNLLHYQTRIFIDSSKATVPAIVQQTTTESVVKEATQSTGILMAQITGGTFIVFGIFRAKSAQFLGIKY